MYDTFFMRIIGTESFVATSRPLGRDTSTDADQRVRVNTVVQQAKNESMQEARWIRGESSSRHLPAEEEDLSFSPRFN